MKGLNRNEHPLPQQKLQANVFDTGLAQTAPPDRTKQLLSVLYLSFYGLFASGPAVLK